MVLRRTCSLAACLVATAVAGSDGKCDVTKMPRTDCGFAGIDQKGCEGKGCCWAPVDLNLGGVPWCFLPNSPSPAPTPPPPSPPPSPPAPGSCNVTKSSRADCGFAGIDEKGCKGKGCCWEPVNPNPGNVPWCYRSGGPAPAPPAPPSPPPSPPAPKPPAPTPPPAPKPPAPTPPPAPKPPAPTPPPAPKPPAPTPSPTPGGGELPGCDIFRSNQCQGDVIVTDPKFEASRWYTPLRKDEDYQASFQDYGLLVAHAHVVYADTQMKSATLEVSALHKDPSVKLTYVLGGKEQSESKASFSTSQKDPLTISVKGADGSVIELDPVDFHWNAAPIKDRPGDYRGGQKGAIVELFGWTHADVEKECKALADMGYLGVKVFPVMEQVMSSQPFNNVLNPWSFMYQPVSYRLQGRMGTRDELRKLINTCRSLGVRVYADAVINHMSGGGNDANPKHRNPDAGCAKWPNKTSSMPGGHSPYYTQDFSFTYGKHTGQQPMQEFPAVPYGPQDFHCERALNSWTDPLILNAGWLVGLTDLNTERDNVQERIADYITDLIGIGFSGLRIDAAKHIRPEDLVAIFSKAKRNLGGALPGDFFTWLEVILGGEADLLMCNSDSGYNYGSHFESQLAAAGLSTAEVQQIKTWNSGYPKEPQKGTNDCSGQNLKRQVIQNDDHDQQNPGSSSRDMGNEGCVLIKGCDENEHRGFEVKLFQNPNGVRDNKEDYPIRNVLSSYYWGEGDVQGVPDGLSDCSLCTESCESCHGMKKVPAFDASSKGYDKGAGMYTRVHRDQAIVNAMRAWMGLGEIDMSVYAEPRSILV